MLKTHPIVAATAITAFLTAVPAAAQEPASARPSPIPVKVTVTISRTQGEKKVSSLPYTISMILIYSQNQLQGGSNLRIGTKVPITSTSRNERGDLQPITTYQDVGTNIDCNVYSTDEAGKYRLLITIDESSVYDAPASRGAAQLGRPTLRSFRRTDSLFLKDGQTAEASNTPDKMTGENVKVEVSLAVTK